ncbi:MAG: DUF4438 domain-containing protein [Oscillospiraceae bacterium]|jgi:hypothetical protein|nr:DUF4438 domain-containing protein [Oscillospiraceae bacterium]
MSEKARINSERLVMQSVVGAVHHPTVRRPGWRLDADGQGHILPGVGGITYNVKIGDSVYAMEGDHVEPGVSLKNEDENENAALQTMACVGNRAIVITGDAKGEEGFVTGMHGGIEHALLYFPAETLEKLVVGDKVQIRAQGQGMQVLGFEGQVMAMNIDPKLFEKLNIRVENGKLIVPVAAKVPAYLMGSGIGSGSAFSGDYDIMTADAGVLKEYGLDRLRYGDIVLLQDCDNTYGRGYLRGAVAIGVVVHSNCILIGHGPGVTTLLAAKTPIIEGEICAGANLADYMGV